MLKPVIIMAESGASIVWRINVDALNLSCELLLERFECKQVVAEDEPIIE